MIEEIADRVEELEQKIEYISTDWSSWREQVYKPRADEAAEERAEIAEEVATLRATVETLTQRVDALESTLDTVVGVDQAADSNPRKRATDLRLALIRDAEQRSDSHTGRAQMWWRDVQRFFAQTGHGDVSKPDCYKAMRWAAGEPEHAPNSMQPGEGFKLTTKQNDNGQDVMAVAVDVDEIPGSESPSYADSGSDTPSSSPTTVEVPQRAGGAMD
jgi:outer membrane murein-binding lipoprotein Lpp